MREMSQQDLSRIGPSLQKWGLAPLGEEPTFAFLGGGVSNVVIKVKTSKGVWVVKQALPQLRVSDEWMADPSRIEREAECLDVIRKYLGSEFAPRLFDLDRENFACLIECAPEGTNTWKEELLRGKIREGITEKVATIMYQFHERTRGSEIQSEFEDISNFIQLRIDPYLNAIASRHPEIKVEINEVIRSLVSVRECLVHGDYSPKNILLLPDGRVWLIDCEVAHFGNPNFDIAFCTNHLLLKATHLKSKAHLVEAQKLWSVYWRGIKSTTREPEAVRVLSALMLARVDGKSPVEYFDPNDKKFVREIASNQIAKRTTDFQEICDALMENM